MMTNVVTLERTAALLAGVVALFMALAAPTLAWPDVEEPTTTGTAAYADVTLDIFSGRPSPQWTLAAEQIEPMLPGADAPVLAGSVGPPGLGYRGFLITYDSAEIGAPIQYRVYGGTVTKGVEGEQVTLEDTKGLEEWLIENARQRGYGDLLQDVSVAPLSAEATSE